MLDLDPVSVIYVARQRIEYKIRTMNLDEREIEFLEDELLPCMTKYLEIAEAVFQEQEEAEAQATA